MTLAVQASSRKGTNNEQPAWSKSTPFDAVIIPGVPFDGQRWDTVMHARVLWSYVLYKNGYVKNIIYSGGAVYSPYYEARIMGLYGQALGIPAEHIFYDTLAEHSTENVYYSYLLAKKLGFKSLALGTDPFQSSMLKSFTRKRFATPITHLPFIADSLKAYNHLEPVIHPKSAHTKDPDWQPITESQSGIRRLLGTLGKNIPWKKYPDGRVPAL
ncbi:MAG: YdcF family protein [Bacteroidetes bacterium]|nr:YdcF family protein [Bacteroidota bacterium]